MKTLTIVTSISEAMLLAGLAFGQATLPVPAPSPNAGMEELTGVVSDAICKGMHFCKAVTPFGCTLECVQEGANWSWALRSRFWMGIRPNLPSLLAATPRSEDR